MITLRNLHKSYGAQTLYEGVSLQVNRGDRFALVGPNGAGKSTLFKMILKMEEPDSGELVLSSDVSMGYLPQETPHVSERSVLAEILDDDFSDNRLEAKSKKILMGLGFKVTDFERPVKEFSGGWQMRVMIAKLLLQNPDILMLDEPTNHLDLESLLWFQNFLQDFRGALFVISHDREFINSVTDKILEVRAAKLTVYSGPYETYLELKKQEEENLLSAYKRQQKEIEELELFISRFRAKASLAASVQSKIKYLEKMEKIEIPNEAKTVGFSFPQPKRSGHNVLTFKDLKQSYDGVHWVYDGLDLTLERGQKIALVGPNGAGKSTMLKLLAGILPYQAGERKLGFDVEVGYFSQHRADMFKPGRTVFEEAVDTRRAHSETGIRSILGSFLFSDQTVFKKIEVLSGGEKSRLGLAKILLDPPNLLLMDEPTTHLDMTSVDVLVEALKKFEGTFVFVSHDVYFIRQLANIIIHVNKGKVTWYPGEYDYFLHKKSLEEGEEAELFRSEERIEARTHAHDHPTAKPASPASEAPANEKPKHAGKKTKEQKRLEAEERNARYRAAQAAKAQGQSAPSFEQEQAAILEELGKPDTHKNHQRVTELSNRLAEIQKLLNQG